MQKDKFSTITKNLHDFDKQLFLGFLASQALEKTQYQISYIGSSPLWLYEPNQNLLKCTSEECSKESQYLTFIGQIFCPLDASHTYNRIIYIFYCQKCKKNYKCIKQQTDKNWQPKQVKLKKKIKQINNKAFQIQSDSIQRKQMLKIINRAKIQVQEQIILQQQDQQYDSQGQQVISVQKITGEDYAKKKQQYQKARKQRQYSQKQIQQINKKFEQLKMNQKDQKQSQKQLQNNKTDQNFQIYKKVIKNLSNPIMIYSNIPLSYNKLPLNPRHNCKHCNMKLQLQIQITQQILSLNKFLAVLDWGSLFIYTCTGSCQNSQQQCIVVQYQIDAISQQQINKLKKNKKTRKNNLKKSLQKQRIRNNSGNKNIEQQKITNTQTKQEQQQKDWD